MMLSETASRIELYKFSSATGGKNAAGPVGKRLLQSSGQIPSGAPTGPYRRPSCDRQRYASRLRRKPTATSGLLICGSVSFCRGWEAVAGAIRESGAVAYSSTRTTGSLTTQLRVSTARLLSQNL